MPADLNMVLLEGRLHGDVEARRTTKGLTVTVFRIINQTGYMNNNGEWRVREPSIVEITMFGDRGESALSQFGEGDSVLITGTVTTNEWKDKLYTKIIANTVAPRGSSIHHATEKPQAAPAIETETPNPDSTPTTGLDDDTDLPF